MDVNLLITVKVKLLQKGTNQPLAGTAYHVQLFDEDILSNDFLGEATPDNTGTVLIKFNPKDMKGIDSPLETKPDLYFIVVHKGAVIYKSNIIPDLNLERAGGFNALVGKVIDLGTFLIDA